LLTLWLLSDDGANRKLFLSQKSGWGKLVRYGVDSGSRIGSVTHLLNRAGERP